MTDSIERTVKKNLRVRPGEWERIERAAEGTALSANQLVMLNLNSRHGLLLGPVSGSC